MTLPSSFLSPPPADQKVKTHVLQHRAGQTLLCRLHAARDKVQFPQSRVTHGLRASHRSIQRSSCSIRLLPSTLTAQMPTLWRWAAGFLPPSDRFTCFQPHSNLRQSYHAEVSSVINFTVLSEGTFMNFEWKIIKPGVAAVHHLCTVHISLTVKLVWGMIQYPVTLSW